MWFRVEVMDTPSPVTDTTRTRKLADASLLERCPTQVQLDPGDFFRVRLHELDSKSSVSNTQSLSMTLPRDTIPSSVDVCNIESLTRLNNDDVKSLGRIGGRLKRHSRLLRTFLKQSQQVGFRVEGGAESHPNPSVAVHPPYYSGKTRVRPRA